MKKTTITEQLTQSIGEDEFNIVLNVKKELENKTHNSIKAAAFINAFKRQNLTDLEIIKNAIKESKKEFIKKQDLLEKNIKEYRKIQDEIDKLNNVLADMNSNLRFKQFISIDKELSGYTNIYLMGNGYFKRVFEEYLNYIFIKNKYNADYFDYLDTEEEIEEELNLLDDNKMYIFDSCDEEPTEIDLTCNFDDGIDYSQDYKAICYQVFSKYKIKTSVSVHDCVDFRTEDRKIEFDFCDDDCINAVLSSFNQEPYYHYDHKYSFSLEKLENLLKELKDKEFKTYVKNIEVKIS